VSKITDAQKIEISALTFLALTNIKKNSQWNVAKQTRVRIHDILGFAKDAYKKVYAENTRETIRRQVIHQFEQARVVDRNPDDTSLPTNSPRTHYALTNEVLELVRSYGDKKVWEQKLKAFLAGQKTLFQIYRKERKSLMVPVKLPSGKKLLLSPGKHNEVEKDVIEQFAPRFAPGSLVLYLGDAAKKALELNKQILFEKLKIPVSEHDKLTDVVLYDVKKNWLYLIEAVTSHGPVSPKRQFELEKMLKNCPAERVYVSAFPNFKEFKKHIDQIAWETEVWISEIPDHMIHFNGNNFLGPHK
jgi:hypothetical protein